MTNKSTAAVLIAALIIGLLAAVLSGGVSGASDEYTMFLCDEPWYSQAQFPWEEIFGVEYVPLSMISELDGIEIRENTFLKNVLISYGDRYLTFDLATSAMYTSDGGQYSVSTYLLYVSERYIPAERVCTYLGLTYEKKNGAIRISDKSAVRSFNDLLLEYSPSLAETTSPPVTTAEPPPVTTAEVTEETDKVDEIDDRTVCLTFEYGEYTSAIIDILNSYDVKATFFLTYEHVQNNYDDLKQIVTGGHAVGLYDDNKNIDSFMENVNAANQLLLELLKFKTRLLGDKVMASSTQLIQAASEAGYTLSSFNCGLTYLPLTSAVRIRNDFEYFVRRDELIVFRFPSDRNTADALPKIINFIREHPRIEVKQISDSYSPVL